MLSKRKLDLTNLTKLLISKELIRQVLCFGVIGILATLTHYFVALGSSYVIPYIYLANLIGYLCAVGVSYFGHGLITFKVALNRRLLGKFTLVSVLTFLTSEVVLYILINIYMQPKEISFAVVALTIPVISFVINKFFVFTHNPG